MSTALQKLSLVKRVVVGITVLFGFTATVFAAAVPSYRGAPNSVHAVFSDQNLDDHWVVGPFDFVPDGFPLFGVGPAVGSVPDTALLISLPNFVDELPNKFMRVYIECEACFNVAPPEVVADDPQGIDSIALVDGVIIDPNSRYWDFEIRPNPNTEILIFDDFAGNVVGNVALVEIDTLSALSAVPIPAALPLLMSAIGGLSFFGWRKQKLAA